MGAAVKSERQLVLASQSPRRRELLAQLGVNFVVCPADVDETPLVNEVAADYVPRVALAKAQAAWELNQTLPVLGSDTAVVADGQILGKPQNEADAMRMWRLLSGRTHHVFTAIAVVAQKQQALRTVITTVSFADLSDETMAWYWDTGEPVDKAGAYAIQGLGARFVSKISGSYTAVVGLPLYETAQLLAEFGVRAP